MASITRYVVVDAQGNEADWEHDTITEAMDSVSDGQPYAVIERVYEYDDSSLVYTSTGDDTWPPRCLS